MSRDDEVRRAFERAEAFAAGGRWQEARAALAAVREELDALPRAVLLMAEACCRLHDPAPARAHAEHALALLQAAGDAEGEMRAQNFLGIVHFETGELDGALHHFLAALELAYRLGEDRRCAGITNNLGTICTLRGEREAAIEHHREALAIFRRLGDPLGEAQTLHNLGIAYRDLEQVDDADRCFADAARAAEAAGEARLFGLSLVARAELRLRKGELATAERMARMALLRFDVHNSLFGLAEAHRVLGTVARLRGDLAAARANLDRALDLCGVHAGPLLEAETRLERGILLRALGEPAAAEADLCAAAALFDQLGATGQAERTRALLAGEPAPSTCA